MIQGTPQSDDAVRMRDLAWSRGRLQAWRPSVRWADSVEVACHPQGRLAPTTSCCRRRCALTHRRCPHDRLWRRTSFSWPAFATRSRRRRGHCVRPRHPHHPRRPETAMMQPGRPASMVCPGCRAAGELRGPRKGQLSDPDCGLAAGDKSSSSSRIAGSRGGS